MSDQPAAINNDDITAQFDQLLEELLRGTLQRSCFSEWEIQLLIDIASCETNGPLLREYRVAILHQLRHGATKPMLLSQYLTRRKETHPRQAAKKAAADSR